MRRFSNVPDSIEEVIDLIQETQTGKEVLAKFEPLLRSERVQVLPYPKELRANLKKAREEGDPIGAAFVTEGISGTIYYDKDSELGVLAPFLFHEIVHSLDNSLWAAARHKLDDREKKKVILEAERHAFHDQHVFLEELKKLYPELREFLGEKYPKVSFLNRELLPHEIRKLYGP